MSETAKVISADLTREQLIDMRCMLKARPNLVYGGLYKQELPEELKNLLSRGLIEAVKKQYFAGTLPMEGGFRLTKLGYEILQKNGNARIRSALTPPQESGE